MQHIIYSLRISIHSLRMEGDSVMTFPTFTTAIFQSTPSAWRETKAIPQIIVELWNFNPLPPHGGRLEIKD